MMAKYNNSSEMRPFSDNLVDLHISVVPMNHWVEKLNYASHKVIGDTFSAGFIRVLPETSVSILRQEISEQLGNEIFPQDYVFLKHVGRCLALIRQSQEKQLKVKNFLPPHSIMPEIFVLPGQPAMYTYKVLPPIQPRLNDLHISGSENSGSTTNLKVSDSFNRSLHTKSPYKYNNGDATSRISANSPDVDNGPVGPTFNPFRPEHQAAEYQTRRNEIANNPSKTRIPSSVQRREMKRQQRHVSGKSNYDVETGQTNSFSYEQNRFPPQYNDHNADEDAVTSQHLAQSLPEDRRPSLAKSVLREGPKKRRVRYNMPPQSNASSQDIELTGGIDLPPQHALPHADHQHYANHSSSGSDTSLHESSLHHQAPVPSSQYDMNHPANYHENNRPRKQFIDTSLHVYANPSNHSIASDSNGTQFAPNPHRVASPHARFSPTPPVTHSHKPDPDAQFSNGASHPDSYHVSTKPHSDPTAGDKWEGRDLVKSSSANNDSGYVEHELSDSDEYFYKGKEDRDANKTVGGSTKVQLDDRHDDVTRVGGHVSELHASETVNHSSSILPASSKNGGYVLTAQLRSPDAEDDYETRKLKNATSPLENRHSINPQQFNENLGEEKSGDALHPTDENMQNNSEPPQRVLSEDSSYQYDFYGRTGPARPTDLHSSSSHDDSSVHESQEEDSPNPAEGSKLTYRLSRKGYRIKSSNDGAEVASSDPYYSEETPQHPPTDGQTDLRMHFDPDFANGVHNHPDEEDDSDNEGYQSSLDEFQQELANLTNLNVNRIPKDSAEIGDLVSHHHNENPSPNNFDLEQNKRSIGLDGNPADIKPFSPPEKKIPSRDSISGSSTRSEKLGNPQSNVAIIASATFESSNMTSSAEIALKKLSEDESLLGSGQSRGAPDGMPTQRKINTGGGESHDKPAIEIVVASTTVSHEVDLADLKPNAKDKSSEKVKENEPEKVKTNDNKVSEMQDKQTPSNPLSSPQNIRSSVPEESVNSEESPAIHVPQFTKPDVDGDEIAKSPNPAPKSETTPEPPAEITEPVIDDESEEVQVEKRLESPQRARLWEELQKVRSERRKAEKYRQDLVQHAKVFNSKINQKRSSDGEERNALSWKRKILSSCASRSEEVTLFERNVIKAEVTSFERSVQGFQNDSSSKIETERKNDNHQQTITSTPSGNAKSAVDPLVYEPRNEVAAGELVRDMWKKKFFEEKKKTLPLEETCRRLQGELDNSHRRLVTALESNKPIQLKKFPPVLPPPIFTRSNKVRRKSPRSWQKNNHKIQATRLQHDMDNLQRRIEDAKIKLTGEIKLRHQAEQDVKSVRQELLTKKIRAHIAYRELARSRHRFPIKA